MRADPVPTPVKVTFEIPERQRTVHRPDLAGAAIVPGMRAGAPPEEAVESRDLLSRVRGQPCSLCHGQGGCRFIMRGS